MQLYAKFLFEPKKGFQSSYFRESTEWCVVLSSANISYTVTVDSHLTFIRDIIIIIDLVTKIVNVLTFPMCITYRSKVRNVY